MGSDFCCLSLPLLPYTESRLCKSNGGYYDSQERND